MEERSDPRQIVRAAVVRPSRAVAIVAILAFVSGLRVPETIQYLPFAASLLIFGLPHGAVDHLVPARLSGRAVDLRGVLGVGLLYLIFSGLCLALWFANPTAAFVIFILVTVFHWGAGDLHALLAFGPSEFGRIRKRTRVLLVIARGGIPMLVPLLAFPGVYREVAADTAGLFGAGFELAAVFSPSFRLAAGVVLAAVVVASLASAARDLRGARAPLASLAAETLLLVAFFAVVPPILAVGLYFALWHAPRHIARLVLLDETAVAPPRAGDPWRSLVGFARDAAPLTAVALALLAALYLAVPGGSGAPGALLALYLVLVSALTIPHAAIVTYMDWRQGIWRPDRRPV